MNKIKLLVVACFLFASFGCGSTPTTSAYSCSITVSSITTCYDLTGSGYSSSTTAQTACSSITSSGTTSTYAASACSTSGRIGSCKISAGQATEQTIRYLSGYNSTTAQAACTALSGTFTSG